MQLKQQIELERDILKKFFSPQIVQNILKISKDLADQKDLISKESDNHNYKDILKGSITEGIIAFIDIRNSTFLSMNVKTEEFTKILNDYITIITDKVLDCGGTINKIMGDGLLITYEKEDIKPFLDCIIQIIKDYRNQKFPPLIEFGISAHLGKYYKGVVGNEHLLEYTILGEDVNLAAKLQILNKQLKTTTILTDSLVNKIPEEFQSQYGIKKIKTIQWKYHKNKPFYIYTIDENILNSLLSE
jgi:hypothetical protein